MKELSLKIDELKPSASNVRAKHTKEDIAMMANSIEHRGIINPITVARNGDGKYEIIAGRLRYEGAKKAGFNRVTCDDVSELSDAERVDVSLSENVDRRRMTAIQYHVAFNKLFKSGMPVEKIAERFGKVVREVQQLLAIGSLPKKILDLAESGSIGDRTLQALAISSGKDVIRYSKLTKAERPRDWDIQTWLAGDKGMYLGKNAHFPVDEYKGPKIVDLFADEDEVWLTDGEQFWRLQNKHTLATVLNYKKKGWSVEKVDSFQTWAHDKTSKKDGGKVYYTVDERTGVVKFHVGYTRQAAAGKAQKAKGTDGKPKAKPDTSQAFDRFMKETRHAAVQRHMLDDNRAGLVGTLILLLKQSDNIRFATGRSGLSDAYGDSLHSSDNYLLVYDDFCEMLTELGLKDGHTWEMKIDKLGPKLMEYTPKTLQRWIITTVVRNWEMDGFSKDGDAIGKVIGLKTVNVWEADAAFWDGIKNKATLIKIAKDQKIAINEGHTAKKIRARISEKIADSWRPDWLKF